jgi:molybdenum cofactor sulfurtransferase
MANQALDIAQEFYPESIDEIRDREYPTLRGCTPPPSSRSMILIR